MCIRDRFERGGLNRGFTVFVHKIWQTFVSSLIPPLSFSKTVKALTSGVFPQRIDRDVFLVSNEILYIAGAIYAEFPLFWESYNDYFLAYKFARA